MRAELAQKQSEQLDAYLQALRNQLNSQRQRDAERALERVLKHKKADTLTPEDVCAINTARESLSTIAAPLVAQWEREK